MRSVLLLRRLTIGVALAIASSHIAIVGAQRPASAPAPAAAQAPVQPAPPEPPVEPDPDSPLSSLRLYLDAANAERWDVAGRYLRVTAADQPRRAELAERLKAVLDARRVLDLETVSGLSGGRRDDGLSPDLEQVATTRFDGRDEPVRLVRSSDAQGRFWAFSSSTVARVDDWYADLPDRRMRDALSGTRFSVLLRAGALGILWIHWILLPFVALAAWTLGRVLQRILRRMAQAITSRTNTPLDERLAESFGPPLILALTVVLFAIGCLLIHITREAMEVVALFTRPILAFALFWGFWRAVPVTISWAISRSWAANSASARHLLSIGANILRGIVGVLGVLAMVAALGYPVGTILAGVGIGGLALAFGAQKTIENLFGSMALAVDQPFRIGDFVKVEDFVGTVEDVGLRSTRFRTLDRTVVTIPNGKLADQRLESFEARDRMRLATTVGLTYDTTQSQMREVLVGMERVLRTHPKIWPEPVVVKFREFTASSLDIEIMAWFNVPTWGEFQICREQVLLDFMGIVETAGASFAFPTRTVHLVGDSVRLANARTAADPAPLDTNTGR